MDGQHGNCLSRNYSQDLHSGWGSQEGEGEPGGSRGARREYGSLEGVGRARRE